MMWRSNYRNQVENEWKNRIKGNHKTFGLPSQRDADTVVSSNKKCTGRQSSSKRECLKEKRFPPVPKSGEKPLEIEKIDHNFVAENSQCVEKKGKEFSCKALFPPVEYVHKRDYGTLPMYLVRRKQEEERKAKLKSLHELERVNTEKEEQQKTINTYEKASMCGNRVSHLFS
ncbi:uncharacterized protein LOC136029812 isoform X1 [Artemia franciscana]|uniref:uncharacterized protein LOC136029812 isoform X1 n=1 Tax=Artemia franciscana TaxID=6661 RepID=UPI0032DABDEA